MMPSREPLIPEFDPVLLTGDHVVVLIFNSIHRVLRAESLLEKNAILFVLQPTPRPLYSSCGLSIRIGGDDYARSIRLLADGRARIAHAYVKDVSGFLNIRLHP